MTRVLFTTIQGAATPQHIVQKGAAEYQFKSIQSVSELPHRESANFLSEPSTSGSAPGSFTLLLKAGGIPAFKVGTEWRFDRAAIDRWAEALEP